MTAAYNIDQRHGFRARPMKIVRHDGTIEESDTSKILEKFVREQGLEADVRADWFAINRKCSVSTDRRKALIEQARALRAGGMKVREIASALGVPMGSIGSILAAAGVARRHGS